MSGFFLFAWDANFLRLVYADVLVLYVGGWEEVSMKSRDAARYPKTVQELHFLV